MMSCNVEVINKLNLLNNIIQIDRIEIVLLGKALI